MDKTCKKCGNNLYGNKLRCPFCGEPISGTSAFSSAANKPNSNNQYRSNQFSYANKPRKSTQSSKMQLGVFESFILLLIAFFIPPFGVVFFFGFNKDRPNFSYFALIVGIIGFIRYTT